MQKYLWLILITLSPPLRAGERQISIKFVAGLVGYDRVIGVTPNTETGTTKERACGAYCIFWPLDTAEAQRTQPNRSGWNDSRVHRGQPLSVAECEKRRQELSGEIDAILSWTDARVDAWDTLINQKNVQIKNTRQWIARFRALCAITTVSAVALGINARYNRNSLIAPIATGVSALTSLGLGYKWYSATSKLSGLQSDLEETVQQRSEWKNPVVAVIDLQRSNC